MAGKTLSSTQYAAGNGRALVTKNADGVERKEEQNTYVDVTALLVKGAGEKTWTRTKEYTYLNSGYVGRTTDNTTGKTSGYSYDLEGGVTGSKYSYTYDKGGNITQETAETVKKGKTVSKTTHTYSYAAKGWKDQLLSYKTTTVTYDGNGKEKS